MNLRRIFANAIARRVAYVVVAIALAWLGLGDARAQAGSCPSSAPCSRPQAYQACMVAIDQEVALGGFYGNPARHRCEDIVSGSAFRHDRLSGSGWVWGSGGDIFNYVPCPAGSEWDPVTHTCGQPCEGEPPLTGVSGPGDAVEVCSNGCRYSCGDAISLTITIDGVPRTICSVWNTGAGQTCAAGDPAPIPEATDTDGDGSSDPNDNAPNNPGESGDGSGQDDSTACGGQGQPACAEDGSNAGSGNGNTSGGGGNCQSPPTSSGDAILAQIAFQTWATRCAIEGNANEGDGTGDGPGEGDGEQPDWTKGNAPDPATDDTDYVADQTDFDLPVSTDMLDQENIFGAASCPNFTIRVWTATVNSAEWDHWCRLVAILRGFILIFGAFTAIQILLGKW